MIARYDEASVKFFDEMAKDKNTELREMMLEVLRECALSCAVEAANNPTAGIGQWSGGRISICEEWAKGMDGALARQKGSANPDGGDGLAYPPI